MTGKSGPQQDIDVVEPAGLGHLQESVGYRVRRIANKFTRSYTAATDKFELRSGTYSCLEIIASNPGISQNEIAHIISIDKTAVMQIVDQIEQRGLGKRTRSMADRRRHELHLTPEGEALRLQIRAVVTQTETKLLENVRATDVRLFSVLLDQLLADMP